MEFMMGLTEATDAGVFSWFILPLLIFLARIADVSIGTIRLIFVSRGFKYIAPLVGFIEVLIWIVVIGQIMKNLSNWVCYVAYAGGFASGNFIGMWIVEKLSLGMVLIRVITQKDASELVENLKSSEYGVTSIDGHGSKGQVKLVFTIIPRRQAVAVVRLINQFHPNAFYSIEEVGMVKKGIFPSRPVSSFESLVHLFKPFRKGI